MYYLAISLSLRKDLGHVWDHLDVVEVESILVFSTSSLDFLVVEPLQGSKLFYQKFKRNQIIIIL